MMSLNAAIFIQWDSDIILYPRETQHFGQLTQTNGKVQNMRDHPLFYKPMDFSTKPLPLVLDKELQDLMEVFEKPFDAPRQVKGRRKVVNMLSSLWYKNDNLGLRTLHEADRVKFLHMPGGHDKFSVLEAQVMFVPVLNL
jgi:hypothetical protein